MAGDEPEKRLHLKGLLGGRQYDVVDLLGEGTAATYTSQTLEEPGLPVSLDRDQAKAFRLRVRG